MSRLEEETRSLAEEVALLRTQITATATTVISQAGPVPPYQRTPDDQR